MVYVIRKWFNVKSNDLIKRLKWLKAHRNVANGSV